VEGLYFLGFPWLRARKSALMYGIKDDAEFITERLAINQLQHSLTI
jgi:putative flavoprotein involved in K+ transport